MLKKKFLVILTVLVSALLTGCGAGADANNPKQNVIEPNPVVVGHQVEPTIASGTLTAVNTAINTITVATISGDELVLDITNESNILVDGLFSTPHQLATMIDSAVSIEYNADTNTLVSIQD